ncbi:uncharacterized protein C9orf85 homolog [Toxorhynchites rutilus septentrionalis]|uniref:uncharacterized protein C9orf85 homolog n=1 Tax=Toxorhynchites rutilus septentrionalis TaxID=329112 RepID=UPI00247AC216|nr:uncharacterized protein C9orf85 homolog [Toxorhynchites rutilus septentrionalis]
MSSRRGDKGHRTRAQKHQNTFAFKNDLHDKHTPLIKLINTLNVSEVCERCKEVIDWKIKYRKYKPLTQPKTCNKCNERKVKRAYHVLCRDCAIASKCCAKCLKTSEEVNIIPPEPTDEEKQKMKIEMDQLIKSLPERKRRTFLRYMNKGEKKEKNAGSDCEEDDQKSKKKPENVTRTREQLMEKFEQLKLAGNGDAEDLFSDDDYEDYSDEEISG